MAIDIWLNTAFVSYNIPNVSWRRVVGIEYKYVLVSDLG